MKRTLFISFLCAIATIAIARPQPAQSNTPEWVADRLAQLQPSRPMDYFELGEEISYEMPGQQGRDLARTLFVLAYQLDKALGPHVCLALADLTTASEERQWLLAMAESMGSNDAKPWGVGLEPRADQESRLRLAEGIRTMRSEDGRAIREAMASPATQEYLEQLRQSEPMVYSEIKEYTSIAAGKSGCPRCRSQRVITDSSNRRAKSLCPRCAGNPGLALTEQNILESLRTESRLRRAEPATWSAIILMQVNRPLRDIRADDLARTYSVDGSKTTWSRELGWHEPPADDATN